MTGFHFGDYLLDELRNFVEQESGEIRLSGNVPADVVEMLGGDGVADPGAFLHECCHRIQAASPVGTAIYYSQFRFLKNLSKVGGVTNGRRYRFCRRMLEPLAEGLALFSQFDFYPDEIEYTCWADDVFRLLASWPTAVHQIPFAKRLFAFERRKALSLLNETKKLDLLLSDLSRPSAHMTGYVWIKSLYDRYAQSLLEDKSKFLGVLGDVVFSDYSLAALILDDALDDTEFEEAFLAALDRILLRLDNSNILAEFQAYWSNRGTGPGRTLADKQQFARAVEKFSDTHLPDAAVKSQIDGKLTAIKELIQLGNVRNSLLFRFLGLTVVVEIPQGKTTEVQVFGADAYTQNSALIHKEPFLRLPLYSEASSHLGPKPAKVFFFLTLSKFRAEMYLALASSEQLLSLVPINMSAGSAMQEGWILAYLKQCRRVDNFLRDIEVGARIPGQGEECQRHKLCRERLYGRCWRDSLSPWLMSRFFPRGVPNKSYFNLSAAFSSMKDMKDYVLLSLISSWSERFLQSRKQLIELLGEVSSEVSARVDESLTRLNAFLRTPDRLFHSLFWRFKTPL